ncbi:hypothetical protein KaCgl_10460 [Corynebacterium glutamicum]|nr:hypothetical protein KaCgl_10460 [Corynebacterium glutamicum]
MKINSPRNSPGASIQTGPQSAMTWTVSIIQTPEWAVDPTPWFAEHGITF